MVMNVGLLDRVLRAALGVALLFLAFASGLPVFEAVSAQYIAAGVGVVMLVVAAVRICPLYTLFGWRACGRA